MSASNAVAEHLRLMKENRIAAAIEVSETCDPIFHATCVFSQRINSLSHNALFANLLFRAIIVLICVEVNGYDTDRML